MPLNSPARYLYSVTINGERIVLQELDGDGRDLMERMVRYYDRKADRKSVSNIMAVSEAHPIGHERRHYIVHGLGVLTAVWRDDPTDA